jgi:uncharacterized membrane protein
MRLWYRDVLQKAVLGAFVGTLTFALALLRAVSPESVPDIGVSVAALAVTVSVVVFLVYLDRFVHNLRPVAVAWNVAAAGARVFEAADRDPAGAALVSPAGEPSLVVCSGEAGIIQAIDRAGLLAAAARHDCLACRMRSATSSNTAAGSWRCSDRRAAGRRPPARDGRAR